MMNFQIGLYEMYTWNCIDYKSKNMLTIDAQLIEAEWRIYMRR